VAATVHPLDREPLDPGPEQADRDRDEHEREPKPRFAGQRDEREREVPAQREQLAVGDVEHVHHPEDDGEPRRHEDVHDPDRQSVEQQLEELCRPDHGRSPLRAVVLSPSSVTSGVVTGRSSIPFTLSLGPSPD